MKRSSAASLGVLLIEDSAADAQSVHDALKGAGVIANIEQVPTLVAATDMLETRSFDVVLIDLGVRASHSVNDLPLMTAAHPATPFIVLANVDDSATAVGALQAGAQDYLIKGAFDGDALSRAIRYAIDRKQFEMWRERLVHELQTALDEVKKLSGLLPICSYCKRIRDDEGYWDQVDHYVAVHSDVHFSHGICPPCEARLHEELDRAALGIKNEELGIRN